MKKYKSILFKLSAIVAFTVALSSCMVGPNFQKVEVGIDSIDTFRFQGGAVDTSIVDMEWQELFNDSILVSLIDSALTNNFDAQIAASRIQESRAYLGMTRADMYPSFSYGGNANFGNTVGNFPTGQKANGSFSVNANVNWELVFWGKYRRATEAAKAELAASEFGWNVIQISLISEVASAYYTLLDFRKRLEIAKRTHETRKESLRIISERFDKGVVPEIDLNQAQIQEAIAAGAIPVYKRSIAYAENALSILIGENPREIITNTTIDSITMPKSIPVGLPSQLLTRRPDVLAAEQMVVAQNARIGVAQAMRFPSISLTGLLGLASADLSAFNASDAIIGSAGAGIFGPIFQFGKNKRRVEVEKERTEQTKLNYKKTVAMAFRETENALINLRSIEEELSFVEVQLEASKNASMLSKKRYDGGVTSYLEVLEADRSLFKIELYRTELLQRKMSAYIELYKTLGGGWVPETAEEKLSQE